MTYKYENETKRDEEHKVRSMRTHEECSQQELWRLGVGRYMGPHSDLQFIYFCVILLFIFRFFFKHIIRYFYTWTAFEWEPCRLRSFSADFAASNDEAAWTEINESWSWCRSKWSRQTDGQTDTPVLLKIFGYASKAKQQQDNTHW